MNTDDKKRILIVDDEADVCTMLADYFTKKGFIADVAYNGKDALAAVQSERPDLIILDVVMPEIDGFKVLETLKSDPVYYQIPIIMLTRKSGPKSMDRGISLNAEFYLPKPCTTDNLMDFVNMIL